MQKKPKYQVNSITAWLAIMAFFMPSFLLLNVLLVQTAQADEPITTQVTNQFPHHYFRPQASSTCPIGTACEGQRLIYPSKPAEQAFKISTSTLAASLSKVDQKLTELKALYSANPVDKTALLQTSQDLTNFTQALNQQIKKMNAPQIGTTKLQNKSTNSKMAKRSLLKHLTSSSTPVVAN